MERTDQQLDQLVSFARDIKALGVTRFRLDGFECEFSRASEPRDTRRTETPLERTARMQQHHEREQQEDLG